MSKTSWIWFQGESDNARSDYHHRHLLRRINTAELSPHWTCIYPYFCNLPMSITLQRLGKQLFFKSPALNKPLVAGYATTAIPSLTSSGRILPTIEPSQSNKQLYAFTSLEGKRLFREAMDQGHAESFFKLMGNFSGQSSSMLGSVSSCKFHYSIR